MKSINITINLDADKANVDLSEYGYSLDIRDNGNIVKDLENKGIATIPTETKLSGAESIDTLKYARKEYMPDEVKYIKSYGLAYKCLDGGFLDHLLDVLTDKKTNRTLWAFRYDNDIQEICDKYIAESQARKRQLKVETKNKEIANNDDHN